MCDFKKWIKVVWCIPVVILTNGYKFISDKSELPISTMILNNIYGQVSIGDAKAFIMVFENLFYIILFNILFGNYIYQDFQYSSIYLFSRTKNREKWFYKKSTEVLFVSMIYTVLFLCMNLFVCCFNNKNKCDIATYKVMLVLFAMITMFLSISTILINIISIRFGNSIGFIVVYLGIVVLSFLSLNYQKIPILKQNEKILILNPMCGVISNLMNKPFMQLMVLLYYCGLIIITFAIGAWYINKLDIALIDREIN